MCIIWQQGRTPRAPAERCWNFADSFRGKQSIRLDCQLGNDRLNAFYESMGYLYTGPMVEGSYEGIKREKTLK